MIVAPNGTTKFAIGVGTTPVAATDFNVTGIVAALDAHAKAVVWAGRVYSTCDKADDEMVTSECSDQSQVDTCAY